MEKQRYSKPRVELQNLFNIMMNCISTRAVHVNWVRMYFVGVPAPGQLFNSAKMQINGILEHFIYTTSDYTIL